MVNWEINSFQHTSVAILEPAAEVKMTFGMNVWHLSDVMMSMLEMSDAIVNLWRLMDMLEGQKLCTSDGRYHDVAEYLKDAKIIIYLFSASWVPAQNLVENLRTLYEENIKRGACMEIVYVSADTEENACLQDFKKQGPWPAIPFKTIVADELRYKYDVTSLPHVMVVKKDDGSIISYNGKADLDNIGINVIVTWTEYEQR